MKRRPRMIFKLLLFLLAGAIINVTVAWGCALWWRGGPGVSTCCVGRMIDNGTSMARLTLLQADDAGLPMRAFAWKPLPIPYSTTINEIANSKGQGRLPLRAIFPGFAINTIFYAVILWVLIATPGALSRKRRLRRGQCASCGYSLRENRSNVCPECGWSSPSRSGKGETDTAPPD
jgi:hypothetical protein